MSTKALFEIINMSDPYTIAGDDFEIVALAVCILGEGKYAAKEHGGERRVPLFLFDGTDEWFKAQFGRSFEESFNLATTTRRDALVECLDSVTIGKPHEVADLLEAASAMVPEARAEFLAKRHDKRRSSLNNIGAHAKRWAKHLQESAPESSAS